VFRNEASAPTKSVALAAVAVVAAARCWSSEWGLPITGSAAEEFLKNATVVEVRDLDTKGITRPRKVELSDGSRTCFAVLKTIDEYDPQKKFVDGGTELGFSDSYRYEIAAYELDKLLGLGIVPPAIERRVRGEKGSLSLWVEGSITEWERLEVQDIHPPDIVAWNHQMYTIRLFLQLIYDTDYKNSSNLLVTPDWKIYKIDSSRAFRNHKSLRREESLECFSRSVLESLRALTKERLDEHLRPWLSKTQIKALWIRRGLILELADRRVAELGEGKVLFD
jgi:hypothetical protein